MDAPLMTPLRKSAWSQALHLAETTPDSRNRYVDFLRAVAIAMVVAGHWLIAAPSAPGGRLELGHMLDIADWTRWLTWLFQVMPVFFMVGGYSNAASWDATVRAHQPYAAWIGSRMRRLLGPVMLLVLIWTAVAIIARRAGVNPLMITIGSEAALVPTWFLAVYVLVVSLVPLTRLAWHRFGLGSFWMLAALAAAVDAAAFLGGATWLRWINYLFVWSAVHQLGYAWRDSRLDGPLRALPWAVGGAAVLGWLVTAGGYPLSMVGVPGEEMSNTQPPTLAMLALGTLQAGLLLSVQRPLRRWLDRPEPWAATILVNGLIMTMYLWHLTAMALVIFMSHLAGNVGLGVTPGSASWWATRPIWMAILILVLLPFLLLFGRFERQSGTGAHAVSAWRSVAGGVMTCAGLALLALDGIGSDGALGIRVGVVALAFAGATVANAWPEFGERAN